MDENEELGEPVLVWGFPREEFKVTDHKHEVEYYPRDMRLHEVSGVMTKYKKGTHSMVIHTLDKLIRSHWNNKCVPFGKPFSYEDGREYEMHSSIMNSTFVTLLVEEEYINITGITNDVSQITQGGQTISMSSEKHTLRFTLTEKGIQRLRFETL